MEQQKEMKTKDEVQEQLTESRNKNRELESRINALKYQKRYLCIEIGVYKRSLAHLRSQLGKLVNGNGERDVEEKKTARARWLGAIQAVIAVLRMKRMLQRRSERKN